MRIFPRMFFRTSLPALLASFALALPAQGAEPAPAQREHAFQASSAFEEYTTAAEQLVDEALSYLGIRYRFGGTSPATGFDCSGLVLNVFRNAVGLDLPRSASEMASLGDKIALFEGVARKEGKNVGFRLSAARSELLDADGQPLPVDAGGGRCSKSGHENLGTRAKRLVRDRGAANEPKALRGRVKSP